MSAAGVSTTLPRFGQMILMWDVRKKAIATAMAVQMKIKNRLDGHLSRLARNSSISADARPFQ